MADLSAVDTLRAAAARLRELGGEALFAALLESQADLIEVRARDWRAHRPETRAALVAEHAGIYHGEALRVARVLLGDPEINTASTGGTAP